MTNINEIEAALKFLESHSREQWVRIGAAIKTELGDAGFDVWNDWSAEANNYNPRAAHNTWKSLTPGKVNINTLFYEARANGYRPDKPYTPPSDKELEERRRAAEVARQQAEAERQAEMDDAKQLAQSEYAELTPMRSLNHEYLVNKLIDDRSLVRQVRRQGEDLVIPLKKNGEITGLQRINKTGWKSFTKGMELKGSSLVIGSWQNRKNGIVLTEGYATAASIHKATGLTTIVCFAGFNIKEVAERLPKDLDGPIYIAADNDLPDKNGQRAGLDYATAAQKTLGDKATVIEPQFTEQDFKEFETLYGNRPSDFNDLHKLHGLEAVSTQLLSKEIEMNKKIYANNSIAPDIERIKEQQEEQLEQPKEHVETEVDSDIQIEKKTKERIDVDKELRTPIILDHDYDHPPRQLKAKYVVTDKGDYIDGQGNVFFKDEGAALKTAKSDMDTVRDMLDVAEAKGWSSIKLNGSAEFKRLAYLEAASRGIETRGYTPNEKDLAILEQLREEKSRNVINNASPEVKKDVSEQDIPLARQNAEKDKVANQNRAPSSSVIEDSVRVDEYGADIPMAGIGGNEIRDEVRAFMNGLTTKQRGLNKSSLATLRNIKELVKPIISGLNKEQRDQAIRNFNEKMDQSIDGQELKLVATPETTRPEPIREYEKASELER